MKGTLTCGESCAFVTFRELDVEECDESLNVVVATTLEMERGGEVEV